VDVANTIDWQTKERSLKASFPLAVANPKASYQIQVGALERGNNDPKKYEVPQHQWMDLTAPDASYGVAVLNDSKYGSDKPDDRTMRLTLVYTPGTRGGYRDQGTQDIGRHDIAYAIAPHAGDWRKGNVPWIAQRLNQPLIAFTAPAHAGPLGKSFALLKLSSEQVAVEALKKAEDSDEIVVRLKELTGKPASNVRVTSASPIAAAREVDGQESEVGAAKIESGALVTDLQPFHLRAFALKLGEAPARAATPDVQTVSLPYDIDAASTDANRADGDFDGQGRTLAAEQLPAKLECDGIGFAPGSTKDGEKNALVCRGQTINLPAGYSRVYLLAAAIDGDQSATFKLGDKSITRTVQDWGGYIGQWDNRIWSAEQPETAREVQGEMCGLVPGFVKRDDVAWFCSHRHHPTNGNEFYQYCYLFKYGFDVPPGATSITLPGNDKVRVFAMSVAKNTHDAIAAAHPLYDTLEDHRAAPTLASISPNGGKFNDITEVTLGHALYWNTGGLHYTTDGSEPTAVSPVYSGPLRLGSSTKLRVKQIDGAGNGGPEASADFDINDTTPPRVLSASAVSILPTMRIAFSEPLNKSQAETAANYRLTPAVAVKDAKLSQDGQTVTLGLAKPLLANTRYRLAINGIGDASPAANRVQSSSEALSVSVARPVFSLEAFTCTGKPREQKVADLPAGAKDPWTINLFVRTSEQPENRTIIAGFGHCDDASMGTGRYLAKFARGVHFWARNCDVDGRRTPLDLNSWQMLSATYDGQTLRLYKDGRQINERSVGLADEDDRTVRIGPSDPWDHQRQFRGEIRSFTIWNSALPTEALKVLQDAGPKPGDTQQPAAAADRQSP
jgi:alpha-mannosidase